MRPLRDRSVDSAAASSGESRMSHIYQCASVRSVDACRRAHGQFPDDAICNSLNLGEGSDGYELVRLKLDSELACNRHEEEKSVTPSSVYFSPLDLQ